MKWGIVVVVYTYASIKNMNYIFEGAYEISYVTPSGLKCLMTKGATAQELFVICNEKDTPTVQDFILKLIAWTFD